MNLRYLLSRIACKSPFTQKVYTVLHEMVPLVEENYPDFAEKYLEMIFLNIDIWKYSSNEIQEMISEHVHKMFILEEHKLYSTPKMVDIMLNCIEVYSNSGVDHANRIQRLSAIILLVADQNFSDEVIAVITSYLNIFFSRRLKNFPLEIYYVLQVYMELYSIGN